jgi:hypothetical protein
MKQGCGGEISANKMNAIQAYHRQALTELDYALYSSGFKRRRSGTLYTRRIEEGVQTLDVFCQIPRGKSARVAYVTGIACIWLTAVNAIALEIVAGNLDLLPFGEQASIAANMGFLSPENQYMTWAVDNVSCYDDAIFSVTEFVVQHVVPFFEEYTTPQALVDGAQKEVRWPTPEAWPVISAAAHVVVRRHDEAASILRKSFDVNAGRRRRFQAALAYSDRLTSANELIETEG